MVEGQHNNNNDNPRDHGSESDNGEIFDGNDQNAWVASGDMASLPTNIFKRNTLATDTRKIILQSEPRNKAISFEPPIMDRKIWNCMPRNARESDKNIRRIIYRFSSVVRPIDNTLRMVYAAKPEEEDNEKYEAWSLLEQTVLNTRALALDALSFANELRQEQALKATISPTYNKPPEKEEVFGDELHDTIKAENETNKLLNDAAWQRKRTSYNRNQKNNFSSLNFTPQSRSSGYKGKPNKYYSSKQRSQNSGKGHYNQSNQQDQK